MTTKNDDALTRGHTTGDPQTSRTASKRGAARMPHPNDYDRTKPLRRAFLLLAWMHHHPRTLAFLSEQVGACQRTVRRDLYTLEQAGIPLIAEKLIDVKTPRRGKSVNEYIVATKAWRLMPAAPCPICHSRRASTASADAVREDADPPVVSIREKSS